MNSINSTSPNNFTSKFSSSGIQWLSLLLLLSVFILAFYPVSIRLISSWNGSDENSHGFLIVPITLFIIWQKKEKLARMQSNPSGWGLTVVIVSLFLYVLSSYAEILTLASFSMVLMVAGSIIYLFGIDVYKQVSFPLFFLLFMIPVPSQVFSALTIPLQLLVSKISVASAQLLGISIYREGNVIELPGRTLQVVQACSGLRSMVSLLTLSTIYGYFTLNSNYLRMLIAFTGVPVAVVVNIIRVVIMIIAFNYFKIDLSEGSVHTFFGVVIFLFALGFTALFREVFAKWDRIN